MFTPSKTSPTIPPDWLHLVIFPEPKPDCPEDHPGYGVYKVCRAEPKKMLPLDRSSGVSSEQLAAIEDVRLSLTKLERAGLCVGCYCQLSEQSSAAESTVGPERVDTLEHPLAEPLTMPGLTLPEPSAPQSEPSASKPKSPAERVSPVLAAASTFPTGNTTASSIQSQIEKDFEFARKLQDGFDKEHNGRPLPSRLDPSVSSSETRHVGSQRDDAASGSIPTIFWNTNRYFGKQV